MTLLLTAALLVGPCIDASAVVEHPGVHPGPPLLISFDPDAPGDSTFGAATGGGSPLPRLQFPSFGRDEIMDSAASPTFDPPDLSTPLHCSRVGQFSRTELAACFGPWAGIAWCESSGDSEALNPVDTDGLPAFGLFQFKAATWRATVLDMGRPDLADVDIRSVPADVQSQVAQHHAGAMGNGIAPWGCAWAWG